MYWSNPHPHPNCLCMMFTSADSTRGSCILGMTITSSKCNLCFVSPQHQAAEMPTHSVNLILDEPNAQRGEEEVSPENRQLH